MDELHECLCSLCEPRAFPSGPREGPQHAAYRFSDYHFRVTLNGEQLTGVVTEAIGGAMGIVITPRRPFHPCDCGSGINCLTVLRGHVEINISEKNA